jgi:uncharacterized RDD family membrane protein YckC
MDSPRSAPQPRIERWYPASEFRTSTIGQRAGVSMIGVFVGGIAFFSVTLAIVLARAAAFGTGRLIEAVVTLLVVITICAVPIGYSVWWLRCARRGQTPMKTALGLYVLDGTGARAAPIRIAVRSGCKLLLAYVAGIKAVMTGFIWFSAPMAIAISIVVLSIGSLTMLFDRDRRAVWDFIAGTLVAESPRNLRPPSASELRAAGAQTPAEREVLFRNANF